MVFGNALQRIADEADVPVLKVGKTAEIIEQLAGYRVRRKGVDREIAASRVLLPVTGESNGRPAAVCRYVAAQRRYLEGVAIADGGHGAVIDASRHRLDLRLLEPRDDLVRRDARREVDVVDRQPE